MNPLTEDVYRLIVTHWETKGYAPSYSELADILMVSKATIHTHVQRLIADGRVLMEAGVARSLRLP